MQNQFITIVVLFAGFSWLLLSPGSAAAILGLKAPGTKWIRVIGVLGLIWVACAILTNRALGPEGLPRSMVEGVRLVRHYLGGGIVGLMVGLSAANKNADRKGPK